MSNWLTPDDFKTVVASTPLISIDLIVTNTTNEILLGQRVNRPAQDYWFVPGGRVLKNETLDEAFKRLTANELGLTSERHEARFLGVYEHFYQDSVFGDSPNDPSTHYIVMGYQLTLSNSLELSLPTEQHTDYQWWTLEDAKDHPSVHPHTQAYLPAIE